MSCGSSCGGIVSRMCASTGMVWGMLPERETPRDDGGHALHRIEAHARDEGLVAVDLYRRRKIVTTQESTNSAQPSFGILICLTSRRSTDNRYQDP